MDGTIDKLPLSRAERHPEKAHRPDNPIRRKPDWIRVRAPNSPEYAATKRLMREYALTTVCEEAACPNTGDGWKRTHGRGAARRVQPQARDRAAALSDHPARRALLHVAAPAVAGEGDRSGDVHQIRPDGGAGRGPCGDPAGDGRPAGGRRRLPDG